MTIDKKKWFRLTLQIRGSVIPTVLPFVLVYGGLVSLLHSFYLLVDLPIFGSLVPNVLFNLVLGLLLVFRTNMAYERFGEGFFKISKIYIQPDLSDSSLISALERVIH